MKGRRGMEVRWKRERRKEGEGRRGWEWNGSEVLNQF